LILNILPKDKTIHTKIINDQNQHIFFRHNTKWWLFTP